MTVYLSIDLGDKRSGLATGDDETGFVSPCGVLEIPLTTRAEHLLEEICRAIREHAAEEVVLGLPLNMNGTEGDRARLTRSFGQDLARRCGRPVHYQDERLTSFAADQKMARSGRTHKQKKQLRDALAAAEVLQDFLQARTSDR